MSRLFGFEVPTGDPRYPRHFEVRWEPPTVLDGAAKLNPALGVVRVWVYELHVSKRVTIAAGFWDGADLRIRPLNRRIFDPGVQSSVRESLRIELQP